MGQIIEPDLASAFAVQDRLADDVLQLAHVLRPIVQAQGKEGGCFEMRGSGTSLAHRCGCGVAPIHSPTSNQGIMG
jgi:hypothetical protein